MSRDRASARRAKTLPQSSAPCEASERISISKTVVALPTDDRAVFWTGKELTLIRIQDDKLEVLDRHDASTFVTADFVSSWIWILRPRSFLIPLANRRIALVNQLWGIDLYDLSSDQIIPSERYGFYASEGQIQVAAGGDNRIWTSNATFLQSYLVDSSTYAITLGPSFSLPTGHSCRGLTLSPDGTTLLAATAAGLDVVDVSSADGTMSLKAQGLMGGAPLLDVAASDKNIAAFAVTDNLSGAGNVLVLSADTLSQLASLPADPTGDAPFGLTLTADGLLVAGRRPGTCSYVSSLYAVDSAGASLRNQWTFIDACSSATGLSGPLPIAASAHHAVLEPAHHVIRIDPATGTIAPITGLEQGSFEQVLAAGPTFAELHSPMSMHLLDLTYPNAPAITQGGLLRPINVETLRIELSDRADPMLVTYNDIGAEPAGARTTLYRARDGALPIVSGSISNDDATHPWVVAGRFLFQLVPVGTTDFRVRRFPASEITDAADQHLEPDVDDIVTTDAPPADRGSYWFQVDARTGDLAVVESRTGDGGLSALAISMFSWTGGSYLRQFTRPPESGTFLGLGVAGGRALVVYGDRLLLLDYAGSTVGSLDLNASGISAGRLLSFDGNLVYLGAAYGSPLTSGVIALRADGLSEVTRYSTPGALSMARVGGNLVFAMGSGVSIVSPACGLTDAGQ